MPSCLLSGLASSTSFRTFEEPVSTVGDAVSEKREVKRERTDVDAAESGLEMVVVVVDVFGGVEGEVEELYRTISAPEGGLK